MQPYLIQLATSVGKSQYQPNSTISNAIRLKYMGSAEFEFGALPHSLKHMCNNAGNLTKVEFPNVIDRNGCHLQGIGDFSQDQSFEKYSQYLKDFSEGKGPRTKERVGLYEVVKTVDINYPNRCRTKASKAEYAEEMERNKTVFWWDLNNNVMFTFDEKLITNLPNHLIASWTKMDLSFPEDFNEQFNTQSSIGHKP